MIPIIEGSDEMKMGNEGEGEKRLLSKKKKMTTFLVVSWNIVVSVTRYEKKKKKYYLHLFLISIFKESFLDIKKSLSREYKESYTTTIRYDEYLIF